MSSFEDSNETTHFSSSSQCFSDEVSQKYQIFTVLNWTTSQLAKMTSVLECIDHLINGEVSSQLY